MSSKKRLRTVEKINFWKLCEELKQPDVHVKLFKDAVAVMVSDDIDVNIRYVVENPHFIAPLVDAISNVENTNLLYQLLLLLFNLWVRCQKYVDPDALFPVRKFRDGLIRLLTNPEFRTNQTLRISIMKCLSEVLGHCKARPWPDIDVPLSMVQDLVETEGNNNSLKDDKGGGDVIVPDQLYITSLKFVSVALVNVTAVRSNEELRNRITREYGEKMAFLSNAAVSYNLPEVARDCCLTWHNLSNNDLANTVYLMRTSVVLDATIAIINKFNSKAVVLTRSAALLFISDVSALSTIGKNRLASARELLVIVYDILSQEYVDPNSLPVLACCKTLAQLSCLDECKIELNVLLEKTMKSRNYLLLMMVLVRWKDYENIVGYVLEICSNISLHESWLFREHIVDTYKPTLEEIIVSFGLNDLKIGYSARSLLVTLELLGEDQLVFQSQNSQSV